jgi:hypothetical protein
MSKRKRLVEDTLLSMLTETTITLNSAKQCLSAVEYARHFPIKYEDVFYLTNSLASLKKNITELSKQFKFLESSKLTDAQSKNFVKIEDNLAMIIFTNSELYNIYMGKDNGETSLKQGPRKLIENVLSGKVKLYEGTKETEAFYAMINLFFNLPPELLNKLGINELLDSGSFNTENWN